MCRLVTKLRKWLPLKWILGASHCHLTLNMWNSFLSFHFPLLTSSYLTVFFLLLFCFFKEETNPEQQKLQYRTNTPNPLPPSLFFLVCVKSLLIPSFAASPRLLHFYLLLLLKTLRWGLGGMLLEWKWGGKSGEEGGVGAPLERKGGTEGINERQRGRNARPAVLNTWLFASLSEGQPRAWGLQL